jgi:hypothetical protein
MEALYIEEKNTAGKIQNQWPDQEIQISAVFYLPP